MNVQSGASSASPLTPTGELSLAEVVALVTRWNRPGPRYTSYPTVPAWRTDFGPSDFLARLRAVGAAVAAGRDRPLSLYVHLPFCQSRCLYCGCNVVISKKPEIVDPYLGTLERELAMVAGALGSARDVVQLHLGGGTPTYLRPEELARLHGALAATFSFQRDAELSIEVDPAVTSPAHLETLRALGYQRISIGVQDVDPAVQDAIARRQSPEATGAFVALCRSLGFVSVNVDLIYGLPRQTPERFARTLDTVLAWRPDRLALFSYAHVPDLKPHQRRMPIADLPDPASKLTIYIQAAQRLGEAGYARIGLDHFALPEDELARAFAERRLRRNFMGFTTQPETDLVAFGMSAISEVDGAYAQNQSHLPHYRRAIDEQGLATCRGVVLDAEDRLRRDVIMDLMCNGAIDVRRIEVAHDISFARHFERELSALSPLSDDGLVRIGASHVEATSAGRWVLRNIAMAFDAYLAGITTGAAPARFSETV